MSVLSKAKATTLDQAAKSGPRLARRTELVGNPSVWAVVVWALCLPLALSLPSVIGLPPNTARGSAPPLVAAIMLVFVGVFIAGRWRSPWVVGVMVGAFAGWVVFAMHTGLYGSPYGFNGIGVDAGRLSAQAERYTTTMHSADGIVGSVPAEYPPLFPWLIARAAVLAGAPAWKLVGVSEALLMSLTVLTAFALWRRMLPDWVALAVTLAVFATFIEPAKAYEVMALDLTIPWALASFASPPAGRLGWLPAGVIGGVVLLLYQAFLVFAALGIIALIVREWGRAPDRRRFGARMAAIAGTALVVTSWYWIPYLSWALTHGLQGTALHHPNPGLTLNPFPFLSLTPFGLLTAVGLLGLVWYWRRAWWAVPLAILTASVYAYRVLAEMIDIHSGSTLWSGYTPRATAALLAAAGVLTLVRAGPALARRLPVLSTARLGAVTLTILALFTLSAAWSDWVLGDPDDSNQAFTPELTTGFSQVKRAFVQWRPGGGWPRFAPRAGRVPWFPVDPIIHAVRSVLGAAATPTTLSFNEGLFAIQPWPGYMAVDASAAASTSDWVSRLAALKHLSLVKNPEAFAHAAAHTPYGPITVFVLKKRGRVWEWLPFQHGGKVTFTPRQFDSPAFKVFANLPNWTVVAVRRDP
ncbi:MAG: arabinofuranosyltransferase [Solirubrobacteraceae bacterium]